MTTETVLLVDGNEARRRSRRGALRSEGFEVIEAAAGADALELAAAKQPSLALLDANPPDGDGFSVCKRLKANPKTALIPVVLLSCPGARDEEYAEALESGAAAYLREPIEPSALAAVIRAVIRRKTERDAADILESIGEAIFLLDSECRFAYANAEARRLFGVEREVLTGLPYSEAVPDSAATVCEFQRALAGRTTVSIEQYLERWGKWFEITASPVSGGCVAVHFRDITGRKHAEEERQHLVRDLTERTGELQAILDAAPVAVWLAHDPQCRRMTGNAYGNQAIMRAPRDSNISRSAPPGDAAVTYKVFRDGVELRPEELPAQVAASTGMPIMGQELDFLFPDGRTVSLILGAKPLFDAEGRVRGSVVAGADVTQLRAAEEALRESEERFRILADSCPALIWVSDAEGGNRFVNRAYREFFGVAYEQVEGRKWQPLIHPEDEPGYVGAIQRGLRERTPVRAEARARRADGEWRWIASYAEPRFSPGGAFAGHSGISLDITDAKAAEEALRESELRYRTLFDSIDEGFCIVEVLFGEYGEPADIRFLEVNQAFENQTGLIGARGGRLREVAPESGEYWLRVCGEVASTGQPARFENRAEQLHRWFDMYATPLGRPQKRQVAIVFNDITERKQAEHELRESEERYRTLFSSMSEGFALGEAICDEHGAPVDFRFIEMNDGFERQSGLGREILGRPMREVLPNLEQVWIDNYCRVALAGESLRFDQRNQDTGRHYSVFCYSPSRGRFAILFNDITEMKRSEQALREAESRYSALFRNRLNAIAHCRIVTGADGSPIDFEIIEVNDACEQITGLKRADLEGRRATEAFPGIAGASFDHIGSYGKIALEGGELSVELFFEHLDRWFSVYTYSPRRGEFVAIFTDITRRKKAEQDLRESERRYRALFESMQEGFFVAEVIWDEEGKPADWRYLDVNPAFETIFGRKRDELIGRTYREMFPDSPWEYWVASLGRVARTGRSERVEGGGGTTPRYEVSAYSPRPGQFAAILGDVTERRRAEERLRESERQFRIMGETVPYGVWLCGPDGGVRYCSQSFLDLLQMTQEEQQQFGWTKRLVPEDVEPMMKKWLHCCETGEPWEYEHRIVDRNREIVTVLSKGLPVRDAGGQITCWVGVNLDISARKRAEQALRESEERFRRLVEVSAQIVWVANPQGVPEVDCPSWRAFTGGTVEQWLGREAIDAVHPEDRQRLADLWREAVRSAAPFQLEYRLLHRSGEYRYIDCHAAPVFNPDGTIREWVGMSADITQRKQAQHALAEAIQRLDAHMDNSPLAVIEFDPQFRVTRWSKEAERVFGWRAEEVLGRAIAEVRWVCESDVATVQQVSADMLAGKRPRNLSVNRNYRKDGAIVECEWYNSAIYDRDGNLTSILSQVLDITDRKRTEERLRQAQKLESVGLLAGGIAHDFNNLLTGIMGNASMLLEEVGPQAAQHVKDVIGGAERAANLTRQLLAYSGKGQFIIRNLDVSQAVNEMADLAQFSIPKSVELALNVRKRLPAVRMDPGQLQQILMNLVINAGEAIGDSPGKITVGTLLVDVDQPFVDALGQDVAAGRYVAIEVTDSGAGIDEETKSKIFDPFFTTKFTGRGLGLAAVAGIVRSQKGAITLDSAPGRGATFRVLLPVAGRADREADEQAGADGRLTILVVDDEPSVRDFIAAALRRQGYRVLTASDGREALAVCERQTGDIDAAILDIVMPRMGANDLLPALKAQRPRMKTLLTSGYSESEARRLCAAYPGAVFIQKPYTAQRILHAVRAMIGESSR